MASGLKITPDIEEALRSGLFFMAEDLLENNENDEISELYVVGQDKIVITKYINGYFMKFTAEKINTKK